MLTGLDWPEHVSVLERLRLQTLACFLPSGRAKSGNPLAIIPKSATFPTDPRGLKEMFRYKLF